MLWFLSKQFYVLCCQENFVILYFRFWQIISNLSIAIFPCQCNVDLIIFWSDLVIYQSIIIIIIKLCIIAQQRHCGVSVNFYESYVERFACKWTIFSDLLAKMHLIRLAEKINYMKITKILVNLLACQSISCYFSKFFHYLSAKCAMLLG